MRRAYVAPLPSAVALAKSRPTGVAGHEELFPGMTYEEMHQLHNRSIVDLDARCTQLEKTVAIMLDYLNKNTILFDSRLTALEAVSGPSPYQNPNASQL